MKLSAFTLLATVFLSSTASAAVANVPRDTVDTGILLEPKQCGAADFCRGTGGGKLCNNRAPQENTSRINAAVSVGRDAAVTTIKVAFKLFQVGNLCDHPIFSQS
ncbi:hypothetical protein DL762_000424 [Monosporascus cannonballus]|uniref:Uncharacterized protein n=1 Tax=Monosporascus cannonballus TaxID=155416 RepID=A0ABY0HNA1_9PEZI|nr:hypothetical protein DL762_000424 [Monosporascus cannonballus]